MTISKECQNAIYAALKPHKNTTHDWAKENENDITKLYLMPQKAHA